MYVYTKDHIFVWRLDSFGEREFQSGRMEVEERFDTSLDFLRGEDILKVLYINTDYDYLHRIEAELSDVTGNLDVSYSSNRFLEFNHKGVNKGDGLIRLARLLNVPISDTVAIGDNFNDLPMIQAAGLGIGVANSVQGILPYCNLVTSADCDHDAVAEVIERFLPECGQ